MLGAVKSKIIMHGKIFTHKGCLCSSNISVKKDFDTDVLLMLSHIFRYFV